MTMPRNIAAQTLFVESPGQTGILVTKEQGRKRTQKPMQFRDGHAALDWCDANKVALVYLPAHDPKKN
jgi:hypothetical protein